MLHSMTASSSQAIACPTRHSADMSCTTSPEASEVLIPAHRLPAGPEKIVDDVTRATGRNSGRIACTACVVIAPDEFDKGCCARCSAAVEMCCYCGPRSNCAAREKRGDQG